MKVKFKICTALFGLMLSIFVGTKHQETTTVKADSKTYIIDSFNKVPDDWTLYSRSDASNTVSQVVNNELIVTHVTDGNPWNKYYGAVYQFETENYEDFTFQMEFKMNSYQDESRFVGMLWHINEVNDYLNALYMNYRVKGENASSVIHADGKFTDDPSMAADKAPVALSDGNYHKLKIIMIGDDIYEYIDNNLLRHYSAQTKYTDELLTSSFPKDGRFGILVNKCSIKIKSINITDVPEDPSEIVPDNPPQEGPINDEELVTTYQFDSNLINFPTVVADIKNKTDLAALASNTYKPSNAILRFNKDKDVVDIENNKIDSFKNIFLDTLKKEIIPIVKVEDIQSADALIAFLNDEIDILDLAVMSSKPELVKRVKNAKSRIRGIISFENSNLSMIDIVQTLNKNYATVAIFSQDMATVENVYYVQARFKTVWVNLNDDISNIDIYNAINSSCYGVISKNYTDVYDTYKTYDSTAYVHPVFNAAHRGLPKTYHENSASGVKAAIEAGATHLEIDCYLTTDNKVVLMHDGSIDRTTNGSGSIESFSLEELRQFKLDAATGQPLEDIPILEDIIEVMQGNDSILILEVKSGKVNIVNYIQKVLAEYDFFDRVIFISFNLDIIGKLKEVIPECPTAYLGGITGSNFAARLKISGEYNTLFDTDYTTGITKVFNEQYLRDRGIVGWYWTFDGAAQLEIIVPPNGYVGITNNNADRYAEKVKFMRGISTTLEEGQVITDLDTLKIEIETYNGTSNIVDGKIFSYEDKGTYYSVICSYLVEETVQKTYYTQAFIVYKHMVTSIEIESYPIDDYEYGDSFSVEGGTIKVNYADGTYEIVDLTLDMVTIPDMTQSGTHEIVVTYENNSTTYTITVKNQNIEPGNSSNTSAGNGSSAPGTNLPNDDNLSNEINQIRNVAYIALAIASVSIICNVVLFIVLKKKKI